MLVMVSSPVLAGTPWSQLFPNAGQNDVVVIEANQSVTLDSNVRVQGIVVKGVLNVADGKAITLKTQFALVLANGLFEIGNESSFISANPNALIKPKRCINPCIKTITRKIDLKIKMIFLL